MKHLKHFNNPSEISLASRPKENIKRLNLFGMIKIFGKTIFDIQEIIHEMIPLNN